MDTRYRETFATEYALWKDRWRSTAPGSDEVFVRYRQLIGRALTRDQFLQASAHVMSTCTFFPTPQEVVDAALGSMEDRAKVAWQVVMDRVVDRKASLDELDDRGRYALQAVGGLRRLGVMRHDQVGFVRSEFVDAYMVGPQGRRMLPGARLRVPRYGLSSLGDAMARLELPGGAQAGDTAAPAEPDTGAGAPPGSTAGRG